MPAAMTRQPEAVAGGLPAAERSHNRVVQALAEWFPGGAAGGTLARVEGRHRLGGNALRAAVLGANDGLVSNLSLVMGVAGAEINGKTILLTGVAGLHRRRLLDGVGRMAVGDQFARVEPAADRHRGRRTAARARGGKRRTRPDLSGQGARGGAGARPRRPARCPARTLRSTRWPARSWGSTRPSSADLLGRRRGRHSRCLRWARSFRLRRSSGWTGSLRLARASC